MHKWRNVAISTAATAVLTLSGVAATAAANGGSNNSTTVVENGNGNGGNGGGNGGGPENGNGNGGSNGAENGGSNGTVKVFDAAGTEATGNDPQVGCDFTLVYDGFDQGSSITSVVVRYMNDTESEPVWASTGTVGSPVAVDGDDLHLLAVDRHHVELSTIVETDGVPTEMKTKVFWIACQQAVVTPGGGNGNGNGGNGGDNGNGDNGTGNGDNGTGNGNGDNGDGNNGGDNGNNGTGNGNNGTGNNGNGNGNGGDGNNGGDNGNGGNGNNGTGNNGNGNGNGDGSSSDVLGEVIEAGAPAGTAALDPAPAATTVDVAPAPAPAATPEPAPAAAPAQAPAPRPTQVEGVRFAAAEPAATLAVTGSDSEGLAQLGASFVALGAALLVVTRIRRQPKAPAVS